MESHVHRIVVLFSGTGGNLENLITTLHGQELQSGKMDIVAAVTNRPDAKGLVVASGYGVHTEVLDHTLYESREAFDAAMVALIKGFAPDLVVMAGFMRIVTPVFTSAIEAINLHPSLLPKYKGTKAIERSFESGDKEAGVSVHWVHDELDSGDLILQRSFERAPEETLESFTAKIKQLEYELLPEAVITILNTKVS